MNRGTMPMLAALVLGPTIALAGCAGDPARLGDAQVRPGDRPECQVSSSTDGIRDDAVHSASHARCHPDESLKWSSGDRGGSIKPDFSGGND